MDDVLNTGYPDVPQSFGIAITVVFSVLIFSPVILIEKIIDRELAFLLYYLIAIGVPFSFVHRTRKKEMGIGSYPINLIHYQILPILILSALMLFVGICIPVAELIPISDFMKRLFSDVRGHYGIYHFIAMVIAAPILEELICRGIILDGLLKKYSPTKAIVISSIIFGLIHLNPWQFITALFGGLFMGWVYYRTRNLLLPITIHASINLFGFVSSQYISGNSNDFRFLDWCGGFVRMVVIIGPMNVILVGLLYYLHKYFSKCAIIPSAWAKVC